MSIDLQTSASIKVQIVKDALVEVPVLPTPITTNDITLVLRGGTLYAAADTDLPATDLLAVLGAMSNGDYFFRVIDGAVSFIPYGETGSPSAPPPPAPAPTPPPSGAVPGVGPYLLSGTEIPRIAGPLLGNHTLANIVVGRPSGSASTENRALAYFRATESSVLSAARIFFTAVPPSYSLGNGGTIEMKVWPVDVSGYKPDRTGTHLGASTYTPNLVSGSFPVGATEHEVHTFTGGSAALVAGNKYVIEFINTAANNYDNFISVDYFSAVPNHGISSDWVAQGEWGAGINFGAGASYENWGVEPGHNSCLWYPCMELHYANGVKFGFASVITGDIHDGTTDRITVLTSTTLGRARINLGTSRTIAAAYLYCSARVGGAFNWSLKDGATVLASGSVSAVAQAYTALFFPREYKHGRVLLNLGSVTLTAGTNYDLEITPTGNTQLLLAANHDGRGGGYASKWAKPEHVAQFWNGSAWVYASSNPNAYGTATALASYPLVLVDASTSSGSTSGTTSFGPEKITSGDFAASTGWTVTDSSTGIASGVATITSTGTNASLSQVIADTPSGTRLRIVFTYSGKVGEGLGYVRLGGFYGTDLQASGTFTEGTLTFDVNAPSANPALFFMTFSTLNDKFVIDNVSVKEIL